MDDVIVRLAGPQDIQNLAEMFHSLWPGATIEEHSQKVKALLSARAHGALPAEIFLAEVEARLIGFVEVDLRSHADGCDPKHPTGYIEGWYVDPTFRRKRIGAQLISAAEDWARSHGCTEMASDTWVDNLESQSAHQALGFEVVDRCVHYRKSL